MLGTIALILLLLAHKKKMGVGRLNYFGGNSGYQGYSMSKRAVEARAEGKFPKGDFRKEYNITLPSFEMLLALGIINNSEWHHTSMYGNRTTFYSWEEPEYAETYKAQKKLVDKLSRENDKDGVKNIFNAADEQVEQRIEIERQDFLRSLEDERIRNEQIRKSREEFAQRIREEFPTGFYQASNGALVDITRITSLFGALDATVYYNGEVLTKRHGKARRDAARRELKEYLSDWAL